MHSSSHSLLLNLEKQLKSCDYEIRKHFSRSRSNKSRGGTVNALHVSAHWPKANRRKGQSNTARLESATLFTTCCLTCAFHPTLTQKWLDQQKKSTQTPAPLPLVTKARLCQKRDFHPFSFTIIFARKVVSHRKCSRCKRKSTAFCYCLPLHVMYNSTYCCKALCNMCLHSYLNT